MLFFAARRFTWFLLLILLSNWLPQAQIAALPAAAPAPPAGGALSDPPPPLASAPVSLSAPTNPAPGLALELAVAPDPLAVGETATLSVTITNRSPYAAEALDVSVPTPDGALVVPGPGTVGQQRGWRWTTHLEATAPPC